MPSHITCSKCNIKKTLDCFYKRKDKTKGYRLECKECMSISSKERWKNKIILKEHIYVEFKTCSRCKIEKLSNMFQKRKESKDGLRAMCKECQSKQKKEYSIKNKEKILQNKKDYQSKNTEKLKEYCKKYYRDNKDARKTQDKIRYENNKEEINRKNRESYYKNKQDRLKKCKEYVIKNKEKTSLYFKEYHKKNEERLKQYKQNHHKKYYKENREKILKYKSNWLKTPNGIESGKRSCNKRRSISVNLLNDFTFEQWENVKLFFYNECAYCGKTNINLEQDHFIPVTKGGEYTKNNIICSCKNCNSSKSNKYFFEWYLKQAFYSKDRLLKILDYLLSILNETNKNNKQNEVS